MNALRIALAGLVALAVAMGIGRFAFTPILPLMLHDGVLDLTRASWLASANYLGYLGGALAVTFEPAWRRRLGRGPAPSAAALVRGGLVATTLLTLSMALPWPAAWPTLRFLAGVASAWVMVHASGWCLSRVAALGRPRLGGVMFAGPGAGIVASGLVAGVLVSWQWSSAVAWAVFAALAALLTAAVWRVVRDDTGPAAPAAGAAAAPTTAGAGNEAARRPGTEVAALAFAYGLAGFGYIVTATFLPVIARAAIPGSPLIDLFWPIFGGGVVVGALASARLPTTIDRRWLLALAYVVQAAGIGLGVAFPNEAGFAVGSLLLGLPFTVITFLAAQESRRLRPLAPASVFGLATALYALGQVLGPPMVAALLGRAGGDSHLAFRQSLLVAASALLVGAAAFAGAARRWPVRGSAAG